MNDLISLVDRSRAVHDISRTQFHVKDIDVLGKMLEEAATAALSNRGKPQYKGIFALLLSWEADNLGVMDEILELEQVLQEEYGVDTEDWRIPSFQPQTLLGEKITETVRFCNHNETLLIIYYGGHGTMDEETREAIWTCTNQKDSPKIHWNNIHRLLEEGVCDILILLDCCSAASSAQKMNHKGAVELIAACGFETWAPGVGEHSFTRALIDELRFCAMIRAFSVAELYQNILARLKHWSPRYSMYGDSDERKKTPIHVQLSASGSRRSIKLEPLKVQEPDSYPPLTLVTKKENPGSYLGVSSVDEDGDTAMSELLPFGEPNFKSHQVLISIALDESQIDVEAWQEWMIQLPSIIKHVRYEGVYESYSTLLLLSLPVAIWTLLPNNPAFSFIGFISSRNWLEKYPLRIEKQNSVQDSKDTVKLLPVVPSTSRKSENLDAIKSPNPTVDSIPTATLAEKSALSVPFETTLRSKLFDGLNTVAEKTVDLSGQILAQGKGANPTQEQQSQWPKFNQDPTPGLFRFKGSAQTATNEQVKARSPNLTDLHEAVIKGDESLVLSLLDSHSNIDAQIENSICPRFTTYHEGSTALHIAAGMGHVKIVNILLKRGADACLEDSEGQNALSISARTGHEVSMMLLLEECVDINKSTLGRSLLHSAAMSCGEMGVKLLLEKGADVNNKQKISKGTPLHLAATYGKEEVARLLIARGAEIDAKTALEETALSMAIQAGHEAVVRILLAAGSNVLLEVAIGRTVLQIAAAWRRESITTLILEYGPDVNRGDSVRNRTALHEAAKNGHTALVALLLENGADVELSDRAHNTAVSEAKESGNVKLVELLNTWITDQPKKKVLSLKKEYYKTRVMADLKRFLNRRDIEFKTKSTKSELIELLTQHDTIHLDAAYLDGYGDQSPAV